MSSSSRGARVAVFFGALAWIPIPLAVILSRYTSFARLLESLYVAVAVSCACGLIAVLGLRRARYAAARSVREDRGPGRIARFLAWGGLYVGITGALALGVYGLLRAVQ
jgi:hypothetical protein